MSSKLQLYDLLPEQNERGLLDPELPDLKCERFTASNDNNKEPIYFHHFPRIEQKAFDFESYFMVN